MTESKMLSVASVRGGAVIEAIDEALAEVYGNILDPNTEAKAVRGVTLKIRLAPEEDRETVELTFSVDKKLAGAKPIAAKAGIGGNSQQAVAFEYRNPQLDIQEHLDNVNKPRAIGDEE